MDTKWELEELDRSRERGVWDRWGVQDAERRGEWMLYALNQRRIYAPLEHSELPHQFARVAATEDALLPFVKTYGRLGWEEIMSDAGRNQGSRKWFDDAMNQHDTLIARECEWAVYAEPIEWIKAHARTVNWCLAAGHALRIAEKRKRSRECERLADTLPKPAGLRRSISWNGFERQRYDNAFVDFVGLMLEDYLWINLTGVRRRVKYSLGEVRSLWGGNSLLESIYTSVTDSVTVGRLGQCSACGAVFIQTDERQRFCPPRAGQEKSSCMNRLRVRRYRNKQLKEQRNAKKTRAR